jgi:RNA polymerase sigma factor (sigma-70 family)
MITIQEAQKNPLLLNQFVAENRGMVMACIKRYFSYVLGSQDFDDYCQAGNIGLFKAVKMFKHDAGTQFSTYAIPTIIGEIRRYKRDCENNIIKVSRSLRELSNKIMFHLNSGKTSEEVCVILGIGKKQFDKAFEVHNSVSFIDEPLPLYKDDSNKTFGDMLSQGNEADSVIENIDYKNNLQKLKDLIGDRNFDMLKMRMSGLSQVEIGQRLDLSQVQVSRKLTESGRRFKELCGYSEFTKSIKKSKNRQPIKHEKPLIEKENVEIMSNENQNPNETIDAIKMTKALVRQMAAEGKTVEEIVELFKPAWNGGPTMLSAKIQFFLSEKSDHKYSRKPKQQNEELLQDAIEEPIIQTPPRKSSLKPIVLKSRVINFEYSLSPECISVKTDSGKEFTIDFKVIDKFVDELQEIKQMAEVV